jgi:Holliday junction DNA helicase, RuvA subunit
MYESITGALKEKDPLKAIVETSGIAYRLSIPLSTYTRLPHLDAKVHLYLSQVIREDSHTLYAFDTKEDRNLFEMLLTVSGIGPKTALAIVGHMETGAFQRAIHTSDIRLLSKLPGIGKKTAERLIIDMRDKFKGPSKKNTFLSFSLPASEPHLESDAIQALIHLGYNPLDAQKAVMSTRAEEKDESDLGRFITLALKKI